MTIACDTYWSNVLAASTRKVYSQYGEDGVIQRIFADLGTTNRYLVDIGAGDGFKLSNTKILLEAGWHGARFDVAYGADVFQERITAENVCDVLAKYNVPGEFDFLSLDIDGIDWYVLRAILRSYRPRVFVCEVNPTIPAEPPVTIAYDPAFVFPQCAYFGASLGAFHRLGTVHGYTLVYVHECINAFFVRNDLLPSGVKLSINFKTRASWGPDRLKRPWHLITETEYA